MKSTGWLLKMAIVAALLGVGLRPGSAAQTLDLYFIDVEGGQSTLIVTPAGESLLIDTGLWRLRRPRLHAHPGRRA